MGSQRVGHDWVPVTHLILGTFLGAHTVKNLPAMWETQVRSLGWEYPLGEGMAAHSSILAWRIPWQRSLVGYSPWGRKESDMTEQLTLSLLPLTGHDSWRSLVSGSQFSLHSLLQTRFSASLRQTLVSTPDVSCCSQSDVSPNSFHGATAPKHFLNS